MVLSIMLMWMEIVVVGDSVGKHTRNLHHESIKPWIIEREGSVMMIINFCDL